MKAIAAMDPNRVIGYKNSIPWKCPEDLKWFKETTLNQILIMGRKTFESLNVPFSNRLTYVLTNDLYKLLIKPALLFKYITLNDLKKEIDIKNSNNVWVCGGSEVYKQLIPYCNEIYITHIIDEYYGDSYMPPFENLFPNQTIIKEYKHFWIVRYYK